MLRLIETGWAYKVGFGTEVGFTGPQSRDFKRYMAGFTGQRVSLNLAVA